MSERWFLNKSWYILVIVNVFESHISKTGLGWNFENSFFFFASCGWVSYILLVEKVNLFSQAKID